MPSVSFIIPSINRPTLHRTIASIETFPGDEVLVEFDLPKSNMWGNPQRNKAIARAKGDYLAFIDDDDYYVKGHREIMERAMLDSPGKPNLFRIQYPNGFLWNTKEVIAGNISTQMILVPNIPEMLHHWEAGRNMADFIFVNKWKWPKDEIVWRDEIICLMGHEDGKAIPHD
jgi:glycosyltransferase involved in cell wall biosynthesis